MSTTTPSPAVLFFGTPDWAVPTLEALAGAPGGVSLVVTNPDRPAGRGYELKAPPVKVAAQRLGLEVAQPPSVKDDEALSLIRAHEPDVCVVVAYGKILPPALLEIPRKGFVNLHFSLLPEYRGAAPVQRALMDGKSVTGVSIMVLTEGMDEGPVLAVEAVDVDPDETAGDLGDRLAELGADLMVRTLDAYLAERLSPSEQDHSAATYAPKITTEEARIDWTEPAGRIKDKIRGLEPVPGAWTSLRGKRLKIHRAMAAEGPVLAPGESRFVESRWLVGTGEGCLEVLEAQSHGKRRMTGSELGRGLRFEPGERFDQAVAS